MARWMDGVWDGDAHRMRKDIRVVRLGELRDDLSNERNTMSSIADKIDVVTV